MPKPYMPDEVFGLLLDGAAPVAQLLKKNGVFAGVQVTGGSLSINSSKGPAPVVVPAGKCLTRARTYAPGAHPLLRYLAVVDCP